MGADETPEGEETPSPDEWDPLSIDWTSLPLDDPAWEALDDLDLDDDIDERPGIPPDPAMREWRHPSEVAAARAHLERAESERARHVHPAALVAAPPARNGRLLTGVAIGVLVLGVLALQSLDDDTTLAETAAVPVEGALGPTGITLPPRLTVTTAGSADPDPAPPTTAADPSVNSQVLEKVKSPPAYAYEVQTDGDSSTASMLGTALRLDSLPADILVTSASAVAGESLVTLVTHAASGSGGDRVAGEVFAADDASDLALIRVDRAARFGAPTAAPIGTDAAGRVGSNVEVRSGQPHRTHAGTILASGDGLIETSVTIPSGHLGSALVTATGRVVGIVVEGPSMLATAVPIDAALRIAENLVEYGAASPNWVGLTVTSTDGLVEVIGVYAEGPAGQAGIEVGDRLLGAAGQLVFSPDQLVALVAGWPTGEEVDLVVQRGEEIATVPVVVAERPKVDPAPVTVDT